MTQLQGLTYNRTQWRGARGRSQRCIPSLSKATISWLDQYQKGRFEITVNTDQRSREFCDFNRRVSTLTVAWVFAGLLIVTCIITFIEAVFGVQLNQVAFAVFMLAVVISLIWIWRFSHALCE